MEYSGVSLRETLGFKQTLNWRLYSLLAIPWGVFLILRLPYLFPSIFCAPETIFPGFHALDGECYWYTKSDLRYGTGIYLHLGSVLPAGLLSVLQFTPAVRKYRTFHRTAGYLSTALMIPGNVGMLMVMEKAFGGHIETRAVAVVAGVMNMVAMSKAIYHARNKQIASHRAWMLRTWSYLGAILTMRPIMAITIGLMYSIPSQDFWVPMTCPELLELMRRDLTSAHAKWPVCYPAGPAYQADGVVAVRTVVKGDAAEVVAVGRVVFGVSMWAALLLHALAVEIYLNYEKSRPVASSKQEKKKD